MKKISPNPSLKGGEIWKAVGILKKGGVVAYPTDTAYGLAVDATNLAAVKKLYKIKGRSFKNPVHVIPPTKAWIEKLVILNPAAKRLIDELMPGPLTIVLALKSEEKSILQLSAGTGTLGIRRPKYKLALDLASLLDKPITTTSANISGHPNCYSVSEVKKQFAAQKLKPDFYLDGGKLKNIKPSTVVSVAGRNVKILRVGPVSEKQIKTALQ